MSLASVLTRLEEARVDIIASIVAKGESVPSDTGLEALPAYIAGISTGDGAFVPDAFVSGNWTATADNGEIDLDITALPDDGGTPITALQYRLDGGAALALTGTGTGARTITGLANGVEYDVEIRAVNVLGAGAWSDIKSRTPSAGASAPAAFTSGDWTATAGDTEVVLNLTALPSNNGSAITALQYRIDGGTATALTGTGTGSRTITGLTNATEYDFEIRAVNAIGNGPWSDVKSRTPVAPGAGNIVEELMAGSAFGFAIVAGDPTISKFYTETTGASATTECTDGQEIGTIECVVTGRYITYPSGVKPVFHSSGGDTWIELQATGKIFSAQSTFTGAGDMIMAGAFTRGAAFENPWVFGVGSGTNSLWNSNGRAGVQLSGNAVDTTRNGGGSIPDYGINVPQGGFVIVSRIGETSWATDSWRDAGDELVGNGAGTWSDKGGWNADRIYFGSAPDEATVYSGQIRAAMVVRVGATTGQLEDLATFMGALVGLTI